MTFGEKTQIEIDPILDEASAEINQQPEIGHNQIVSLPKSGSKRQDLSPLRNGNWAKELLRLARIGLEDEDSVATVVHEMAKWLWWIELFQLSESSRLDRIISLLTQFVLKKHNGCVTRLTNGHQQDVIDQIGRCVQMAANINDANSLKGFEVTRQKWLNGGYKVPIRIVPALLSSFAEVGSFPIQESDPQVQDKDDDSLLFPCLFTVMCIKFDDPLPYQVQERIKAKAGRNKVLPFATRLLNRLYSNNGSEYLGRPILLQLLGYNNPSQIAKYLTILEKAGVIKRGTSYSRGRNGKLITLAPTVIQEMAKAGSNVVAINRFSDQQTSS